jgi:hypothetical protein
MGGKKNGSFEGSVVQEGMVVGTDVDLNLVALRTANGADMDPKPVGELLGQDIQFKPELLGDPAVALVMSAFPGTLLVQA